MKFEKGKLYVRVFDGEPAKLFYPDENVPTNYRNFHVENISRMRWGTAEPSFGGAVECSQHGERTGAGHLVEFKKASDDDIRSFLYNWSSRAMSSIAEWADNVQNYCNGLNAGEKKRVARIAQAYS
jgi:hypothetical protein